MKDYTNQLKEDNTTNPLKEREEVKDYIVKLNRDNIFRMLLILKGNDIKVLLYILNNRVEDRISLNKAKCATALDVSRETVYTALKKLEANSYIASTDYPNTYFINRNLIR